MTHPCSRNKKNLLILLENIGPQPLCLLRIDKCSLRKNEFRGHLSKSKGKVLGHQQIKPQARLTFFLLAERKENCEQIHLKKTYKFLDGGKETDGDANLEVTKQDIRTKLPQNQDLSNSNRKISWQREAPQASQRHQA